MNAHSHISLSQLNGMVREAIEMNFVEEVWMVAEIAEMRVAGAGHCYLDLVERRNNQIVARMRANIWKFQYERIAQQFFKVTGTTLKKGMQVLFAVNVSFHELYGVSLVVKNVDPSYSLGDLARKRQEIIAELTKQNLIQLNKAIELPLVIKKIAVITSETAAGWGDFQNQLLNNSKGYCFEIELFPAVMQGDKVTESITKNLRKIDQGNYDAIVIIRGGGASLDLVGFDTFELGAEIASCALPVITGIGHERDETICDIVANKKLKTPTAVAEFLILKMQEFEEYYKGLQEALIYFSRERLNTQNHLVREFSYLTKSGTIEILTRGESYINKIKNEMPFLVKRTLDAEGQRVSDSVRLLQRNTKFILSTKSNKLKNYKTTIKNNIRFRVDKEGNRISLFKKTIHLTDPKNVLNRGYAMIEKGKKVLVDKKQLSEGKDVTIVMRDGKVNATIKK